MASKSLVIDTDIARAAGSESARDERAKNCRNSLNAMLETTKHKVVLTKAMRAEWDKHQSLSTLTWRGTMMAQKRVRLLDVSADDELRRKVEQGAVAERKREAMLKDIHLIEAALKTDRIVISKDETVRHCFHEMTQKVGVLKQIAWVNPCKSEETAIEWLQNGAEPERERLLGYRRESSDS